MLIVISAFLFVLLPNEYNLYWKFKSSIEASVTLISLSIGWVESCVSTCSKEDSFLKNVIPVPADIRIIDKRKTIPTRFKEDLAPLLIAKTINKRDIIIPATPIR